MNESLISSSQITVISRPADVTHTPTESGLKVPFDSLNRCVGTSQCSVAEARSASLLVFLTTDSKALCTEWLAHYYLQNVVFAAISIFKV